MPLLMMAIFLTVQFTLVYLGNQVISSAARQAARVARSGADTDPAGALARATAVAEDYAAKVGHGLVTNVVVQPPAVVPGTSGQDVRVVVSGQALQLIPGFPATRVSKSVQGPVESFRADTP